jgi:hypothetical protein
LTKIYLYFHAYDSLRLLPAFVLRRLVLGSFPQGVLSPPVANSVDFMVEQVAVHALSVCSPS